MQPGFLYKKTARPNPQYSAPATSTWLAATSPAINWGEILHLEHFMAQVKSEHDGGQK
jgi:hypothetical protein